MAELSHKQRLERCRAELSMLDDDAAEGDVGVNSADGAARAEQRRAAREESRRGREVELQELRFPCRAAEEARGAAGNSGGEGSGGIGSSMEHGAAPRARDRFPPDRERDDHIVAQLEEAENNNAVLEHEILRLHEENATLRRQNFREATAAKEEIRMLAVKCAEAMEERQDSLEVL
jgi:hypothetical protein